MKISSSLRLFFSLIIFALLLSFQPVTAKYGKYYRDSFYVGATTSYTPNWITSIALAGMDDRDHEYDTHNTLMITPVYRNAHLDSVNKAKQSKIDKLKNIKEKSISKGENVSEIESQIKDLESQLIKARSWDESKGVSFVTYKLKGSLGNFLSRSPLSGDIDLVDFRIVSSDGKVHCNPISKKVFWAKADDEKYLENVYDVILNGDYKRVLVYSYDPKCILDSKATAKHYFSSEKNSKGKFYYDIFKKKYEKTLKADYDL
jgi:hypothetical protein